MEIYYTLSILGRNLRNKTFSKYIEMTKQNYLSKPLGSEYYFEGNRFSFYKCDDVDANESNENCLVQTDAHIIFLQMGEALKFTRDRQRKCVLKMLFKEGLYITELRWIDFVRLKYDDNVSIFTEDPTARFCIVKDSITMMEEMI
jgi:hypothetical protein